MDLQHKKSDKTEIKKVDINIEKKYKLKIYSYVKEKFFEHIRFK